MSLADMLLRLSRFRALLLLMAFALSLAGQFVAGVAVAAPMDMPASPRMSAPNPCPACPDHGSAMPAPCALMSCGTMAALPATIMVVERVALPATFILPVLDRVSGLSPGPDPHPPRALLHA